LTKRPKRHPKSLWKDATLHPRELVPGKEDDIFKIIMPWVSEKEEEEKLAQDRNKHTKKAA